MFPRLIKILIYIIAGLLVLIFGLYYTREATILVNFKISGVAGSDVAAAGDSAIIFQSIDTSDFVTAPYPSLGDTILTIGDSAALPGIWSRTFNRTAPLGREVPISFKHAGDTISAIIRTHESSAEQFYSIGALIMLRLLISLSYLTVGIWAFLKRSDSGAVRALALFCFAMGSFTITGVRMEMDGFASFDIPLLSGILSYLGIFAIFFGAFWLNLQILFPSPRSFVQKYSAATYATIYAPLSLLLIVANFIERSQLGYIILSLIGLQIGLGFYFLGRNYARTREPMEKRQIRLVLWGTGAGMSGLLVLPILALFAADWVRQQPQIVIIGILIAIFLVLLLSPLSFAYAFGKYRLLEVEGRIRRGTRHFLVTLFLLTAFYVFIYFFSEIFLEFAGIESRTPVLFVALALAVGFAPTQKRLSSLLERWIFPERVRLREMLNDYLRQSLSTTDKDAFWKELENRFRIALKVDAVTPVLRSVDGGNFVHWNGDLTPFTVESRFITEISKLVGRPILRDELEAGRLTEFSPAEREWMDRNQVALVLPMVLRSELIGFLGIGLKSEKKDFEPADMEILKSLAYQTAVAAENITLLEESAEKKRLEAEMSIARRVQEGMLPQTIPVRPGLLIAARSRFCTEVAGDYYDVIEHDAARTVLAIGDVSGKGAGAALLMSNVQASLRTAVGVATDYGDTGSNISLAEIVAKINRLIHRNSQPEQFITFFVALFDPQTKTLKYVNAGHNPPLVARRGQKCEELLSGGILLGAVPEMVYEEAVVNLYSGDILFMYTDGLSESTNAGDEMFGEERIKKFLCANIEQPPERLLQLLEEEVARFAGNKPLADDFTLLAAKVQ
ncbi:MAG: SpoIIE family protein phosphatase [Candidatus Zixiibacteriota bacterium]